MSVKLAAASLAALLAGGATATGLGLGGAYGPTQTHTVATTVVAHDTVTTTRTVTRRLVRTVTETTTEPLPDVGGGLDDDDSDGDGCSDSYEGACLDPYDGYDNADCYSIPETDFDSVGSDPYDLDRDGDGIACESY
jgi:hypothetical protein